MVCYFAERKYASFLCYLRCHNFNWHWPLVCRMNCKSNPHHRNCLPVLNKPVKVIVFRRSSSKLKNNDEIEEWIYNSLYSEVIFVIYRSLPMLMFSMFTRTTHREALYKTFNLEEQTTRKVSVMHFLKSLKGLMVTLNINSNRIQDSL